MDYLRRKENNVLTTTEVALPVFCDHYPNFNKEFHEKLQILPAKRWKHENSLAALLITLIEEGTTNIILFGADGFGHEGNMKELFASYYHPETQTTKIYPGLRHDTRRFNKIFPELYGNHKTKIFNCSPNSHLRFIRKIKYEDIHKFI